MEIIESSVNGMTLENCRAEISAIDNAITKLLEQRFDACETVAKIKAISEQEPAVLNNTVEERKLRVISKNSKPEYRTMNIEIFKKIMEMSRDYQYQVLSDTL